MSCHDGGDASAVSVARAGAANGGWGSALLPSNGSHEKIQKIRAPEAPPDPFAPGDAAECEALEKAQQMMLEGQRILAHPRTALFQEQFEKQTRSREARTAEAARALAERLAAEGGNLSPSTRKVLVASQVAAAASSLEVSVGSHGDGGSAR